MTFISVKENFGHTHTHRIPYEPEAAVGSDASVSSASPEVAGKPAEVGGGRN